MVLGQKESRRIMSSTGKESLCPREASSLSLSSSTLTARSTRIIVKSETTSKDSSSSQALSVLSSMKSANSQESNPLIVVVGLGDSTTKESMAAFGVCHSQRMIYFVL